MKLERWEAWKGNFWKFKGENEPHAKRLVAVDRKEKRLSLCGSVGDYAKPFVSGEWVWAFLEALGKLCSTEHVRKFIESGHSMKSCCCPWKGEDCLEFRDSEDTAFNIEIPFEAGRRHEIWGQEDLGPNPSFAIFCIMWWTSYLLLQFEYEDITYMKSIAWCLAHSRSSTLLLHQCFLSTVTAWNQGRGDGAGIWAPVTCLQKLYRTCHCPALHLYQRAVFLV